MMKTRVVWLLVTFSIVIASVFLSAFLYGMIYFDAIDACRHGFPDKAVSELDFGVTGLLWRHNDCYGVVKFKVEVGGSPSSGVQYGGWSILPFREIFFATGPW